MVGDPHVNLATTMMMMKMMMIMVRSLRAVRSDDDGGPMKINLASPGADSSSL